MGTQDEIRAANDRWNAAFNEGDAAGVAALYTDDATVLPHTHDVISGKENIRSFWQSVMDAGFRNHGIELIDVHNHGDVAVQTSKWWAQGAGEDGQQQDFGGSLVIVSERQSDGSWKCRVHIWN